jgi:hypothetical protein
MKRRIVPISFAALLIFGTLALAAGEQVGVAVQINTKVAGDSGEIATGSGVHRNERIVTNASGVGNFQFDDGTKLALGPNSSVVIDEYIYEGKKTAKTLAITAAKGTFRWISGKSSSSAYKVNTPSGALGVRGTAFDIFVGADGLTAVVLLSGRADFCNSNGCQQLNRRCDFLIAKPDGQVTKPRGIVRQLGEGRRGEETFPFLAGLTSPAKGFKADSSCAGMPNRRAMRGGGGGSRQERNETPDSPPNYDGGGIGQIGNGSITQGGPNQ